MRTPLFLALLSLSTSLACSDKAGNGSTDDTGDTGEPGDGGDDGGAVESGCVTLDGSGGYARVNDAIAAATDGATVSLAECTGTLSEAVVLSKAVTLEGGEGVVLTAKDAVPLTITASGAVVRDLVIESDDDAIEVEESEGVGLSNVQIARAAGWGLRAEDVVDLVVGNLTVTGVEDGALRIRGGTAQLSGLTITDVYGYGVRVMNGGTVSLAGSTIRNVAATNDNNGMGVSVEDGSTLSSQDNVFEGATAWNVQSDASTVTSTRDQFLGGTMGVLAQESTLSVVDGTFVNPAWCGIYAYAAASGSVSVDGTSILFEDGEVEPVDPDTWGSNAYIGAGMFLVADEVTVTDSTVTGTGGVGILISGVSSATATLEGVQVQDVDQYGLYLASGDFLATELSVQGVTAFETDEEERCYSVDRDVGVVLLEGDLDWTGGGVSDSEGYGLSAVFGDARVDGITVADNGCAGVMGFGGGLEITGSDFSGSAGEAFAAAVTTYQGTGLVATGNTFHDNSAELFDWSYEYGGGVRTDYYAWFGSDLQLFYGGHAEISGNTFENGVNGVEVYSNASYGYASAELSDNTFTNYKGVAVLAYDGSEVSAEQIEIDGFGLSPIYCEDATLSLHDVTVNDGGILNERYEVYTGGTLTDSGAFTSYGPAVYAKGCSFEASALTVTNTDAWGVYFEGGTNSLSGLDVRTVGYAADADGVSIYASGTVGSLSVSSAEISGADRYGIVAYTSGAGELDLSIVGAQVESSGLVDVLVQNASPTTASGTADIRSSTLTESGAVGLYSVDFDVTIDTVNVGSAAGDGIFFDGGRANVKAATVYDNGGYGLACEGRVEFTSCDFTFSGNADGEVDACDSDCFDVGGDGGASDGGASDGGASDGGASDGGASDGGASDGGASDGGASDGGDGFPG